MYIRNDDPSVVRWRDRPSGVGVGGAACKDTTIQGAIDRAH